VGHWGTQVRRSLGADWLWHASWQGTGVVLTFAERPQPTVSDLVNGAAAGDGEAWDQLVDRFASMVWAVARSYRLNAADAADVSQTTWLRLVQHLDRLEHPERVGAWLAITARHEALRVARQSSRQLPVGDDIWLDRTVDVSHDDALIADARARELWALVSELPARCQLILRLLTADPPLSYRDLAQALDMPIGSIGPTRARCLDHLRKIADSAGISLEEFVS
jgi:RNA polymerase sigma factor (sigma-70 family)